MWTPTQGIACAGAGRSGPGFRVSAPSSSYLLLQHICCSPSYHGRLLAPFSLPPSFTFLLVPSLIAPAPSRNLQWPMKFSAKCGGGIKLLEENKPLLCTEECLKFRSGSLFQLCTWTVSTYSEVSVWLLVAPRDTATWYTQSSSRMKLARWI